MAYSNLVAPNHADWSLFLIVALQRPNIFSFVTELNKNSHSYFLPLAALLATRPDLNNSNLDSLSSVPTVINADSDKLLSF